MIEGNNTFGCFRVVWYMHWPGITDVRKAPGATEDQHPKIPPSLPGRPNWGMKPKSAADCCNRRLKYYTGPVNILCASHCAPTGVICLEVQIQELGLDKLPDRLTPDII